MNFVFLLREAYVVTRKTVNKFFKKTLFQIFLAIQSTLKCHGCITVRAHFFAHGRIDATMVLTLNITLDVGSTPETIAAC